MEIQTDDILPSSTLTQFVEVEIQTDDIALSPPPVAIHAADVEVQTCSIMSDSKEIQTDHHHPLPQQHLSVSSAAVQTDGVDEDCSASAVAALRDQITTLRHEVEFHRRSVASLRETASQTEGIAYLDCATQVEISLEEETRARMKMEEELQRYRNEAAQAQEKLASMQEEMIVHRRESADAMRMAVYERTRSEAELRQLISTLSEKAQADDARWLLKLEDARLQHQQMLHSLGVNLTALQRRLGETLQSFDAAETPSTVATRTTTIREDEVDDPALMTTEKLTAMTLTAASQPRR